LVHSSIRVVTASENVTIENCLVHNNETYRTGTGGGIRLYSTTGADIINCTVTQNNTNGTEGGGGICALINNVDVDVINCIIWDNNGPSGMEEYSNSNLNNGGASYTTFTYCDIQGGWNGSRVYNEPDEGCVITDGGGNINADPNFVNPNNPDGNDNKYMTYDDGFYIINTRAIDAANGNYDPNTDILGNSRYDETNWSDIGTGDPDHVDMGAYESQGS
jgi:hypothetical protein